MMRWPYWAAVWAVVIAGLWLIATGKPSAPPVPMTMKYCPNGADLPCPQVLLECKATANGGQVCTGRLTIGQEKI
jgi:hypothetical protein